MPDVPDTRNAITADGAHIAYQVLGEGRLDLLCAPPGGSHLELAWELVQQRLGHADVSVTLGLNSHVMPGHDHDAAEALAKAVASSRRDSVIKP